MMLADVTITIISCRPTEANAISLIRIDGNKNTKYVNLHI